MYIINTSLNPISTKIKSRIEISINQSVRSRWKCSKSIFLFVETQFMGSKSIIAIILEIKMDSMEYSMITCPVCKKPFDNI